MYLSVVRKAFNDLGYIEGKNIVLNIVSLLKIRTCFGGWRGSSSTPNPRQLFQCMLGTLELKKLTDTIPIVFVLVADPIGFGLVQSLAQPGGNATGPWLMTIDVSGKRLELFKEAVPNLSRVAVLTDATDPFKDRLVKAYQASGERLGLSIWPVEIKTPEDIEPEFSKIAQDGANGIIVGAGGMLFVQRVAYWCVRP